MPQTPRTVKQLRAALTQLGLSTNGLKADLVARFEDAAASPQPPAETAEAANQDRPVAAEAAAPVPPTPPARRPRTRVLQPPKLEKQDTEALSVPSVQAISAFPRQK